MKNQRVQRFKPANYSKNFRKSTLLQKIKEKFAFVFLGQKKDDLQQMLDESW